MVDQCNCTRGVALDEATSNLYVSKGASIAEYGPFGEPFNRPVEQFGANTLNEGAGLAVDASSGRVLVADAGADQVDVFQALPLPAAAPAGVHVAGTVASATLSGTVYPAGEPVTGCRFEYGTVGSGALSQSAPCTPQAPLSGTSPVAVSAEAPVLAPDTAYAYRLTAVYQTGEGEVVLHNAGEASLVTPPLVEGTAVVSNVTSYAATLTGSSPPGKRPLPTGSSTV